jgi:arylsulfatase A-like enzyme
MKRPRPPLALLALLALALLAGFSCGGPETVLSYDDLVASGSLASFPGAAPGDEATCADETRFAVALEPGTEIRVQRELGAEPHLTLGGCLAWAEAQGHETAAGGGLLELEIQGTDGRATHLELPVDGAAWARTTIALVAHAESRVELRLRARAPAGTRLLLSDLFVRHRVLPPEDHEASGGKDREEGRAEPSGPPILLISLDTLRADAVGAGTPALAAFAERAEIWSPHYSAAAWTKPSHASLLTGYPVEIHGAQLETASIDPAVPTLAERLHAAGYQTAGLAYDCEWLDAKWGFDRGFDEYRVTRWDADPSVRATVDWIAEHRGRPFFYFLHLYTPHSDQAVLPYEGAGVSRGTVAERFGVPGYGCRQGSCASQLLHRLNDGLEPLPEEAEILRFLYERGVATTDAALGRLFADLEAIGRLDDMLVVVTSDHGEAFFEHGKVLHSTIHREVNQVPLLIHWPGGRHAGEHRTVPTSSVDLAPTLLAAAGIAAPGLPGTLLHRRKASEPVFAGTTAKAIVVGDAHAIFDLLTGEDELYHPGRDPAEEHDLAASQPEELARLRQRILAHLEAGNRLRDALRAGAGDAAPPAAELTPEERRRLEALGYLQ